MKKIRFKVLLTAGVVVALLLAPAATAFAQEPDSSNGVSHLHNPPEGAPPHGPPGVIVSMGNPQGPPSNLPPNARPPGPPIMVEPDDPLCVWGYDPDFYNVYCLPDLAGVCGIFPGEDYIPWGSYIFCHRAPEWYNDTILCQTFLPTCYPVTFP